MQSPMISPEHTDVDETKDLLRNNSYIAILRISDDIIRLIEN
jgi:hypothetical protein